MGSSKADETRRLVPEMVAGIANWGLQRQITDPKSEFLGWIGEPWDRGDIGDTTELRLVPGRLLAFADGLACVGLADHSPDYSS